MGSNTTNMSLIKRGEIIINGLYFVGIRPVKDDEYPKVTMTLEQATADWDGKSADEIRQIFDRHRHVDYFVDQLTKMFEFPHTQKGATWQLKAFLEKGGTITAEQIDKIYSLLPQLIDWESQLHILQSMQYMPISTGRVPVVETFLRQGVQGKNKFVRAWSYNGLHELASQHTRYAAEVEAILDAAMTHEAASVKSRIRNIRKKARK